MGENALKLVHMEFSKSLNHVLRDVRIPHKTAISKKRQALKRQAFKFDT